jgi:hypothetical protein
MRLQWDQVGERIYETGVDHGVLYIPNGVGEYDEGVVWNGLVSVSESPTGAEATPQYADNIKEFSFDYLPYCWRCGTSCICCLPVCDKSEQSFNNKHYFLRKC